MKEEQTLIHSTLLLDAKDAAEFCGMSRAAWYKRLSRGQVPRPVKIGNLSRWRRHELVNWVDAGCPVRQRWDEINSDN